jgi:hypothetical protein
MLVLNVQYARYVTGWNTQNQDNSKSKVQRLDTLRCLTNTY